MSASVRPSGRLLMVLGTGVLLIAILGYSRFGAGWGMLLGGPAPKAQADSAAAPEQGSEREREQIEAMVAQLAQRLKEAPDDVQGWTMLGRSYATLERFPEAADAYQRALALSPDNANLLAQTAEALALKNGRNLAGEPIALLRRALQRDPAHLKALTLSGAYEFEQKNYVGAVKYWEQLTRVPDVPPALLEQVQPVLAQARQLAGGAAAAASAAPSSPAAPAMPSSPSAPAAASSPAAVSGSVTLSPALSKEASPQDTVFIFARAAQGGRMPLAILRKQVKDLPIRFSLDDSMAMSPAATLSGAGTVVVGARISKSGNAMPQPGDLQGLSAPVAVGSQDIRLEISERVSP